MEGYCLKCKAKREVENPVAEWAANGTPATRGRCPVCGTAMYRRGRTAAHDNLPKPVVKPAVRKGPASKKKKPSKRRKKEVRVRRSGQLVVVESPAKARTLSRYLGPGYAVKSSVGHVRDLLKSRLSVDIEHDFRPEYRVPNDKRQTVRELKEAAARAKEIFLATDPDREGEAIAWHVQEAAEMDPERTKRVVFREVTKSAVLAAFRESRGINMDLVAAQQARRILDRLVGYQISPLLWRSVKLGLSAGRVQSVALRMICEREQAIEAFVQEEYWTVHARMRTAAGEEFTARLAQADGEKVEIRSEAAAESIKAELEGQEFFVESVKEERKARNPRPPFITSTLQQAAARRLRFTARKTMAVAQQLYEGIDLGEGERSGLITYMRTDSTRVASEALAEVRTYIEGKYGNSYLPERPRVFKSPKGAQEAHEAIRPTQTTWSPEAIAGFLSRDQMRLYSLIWERFVASQMAPAIFMNTSIVVRAGRFTLHAHGSRPEFDGFLRVYTEVMEKKEEEEGALPPVKEREDLAAVALDGKQHFTSPPPRYTEATLIRELEKQGIGRPSTYASIMAKIQAREYTRKDQRHFVPTPLGRKVIELLVASFPKVMDVAFTAGMEEFLDEIGRGKKGWLPVIKEFYGDFKKSLDAAAESMKITTDVRCPVCGARMIVRGGLKKQYLACGEYPRCKTTRDFVYGKDEAVVPLDEIELERSCDKCGKPMVMKNSRWGPFLACSGFPDCRNTLDVELEEDGNFVVVEPKPTGVKCPNDECAGDMVERRGRYGKFLACSLCGKTMPVPTDVPCPREGCDGMLVRKRSKAGRYFYGCSRYPDCDFITRSLKTAKSKQSGSEGERGSEAEPH